MKHIFYTSLLLLLATAGQAQNRPQTELMQIGEDLQLIRLTENTFIHRSFRMMEEYGRVPANGLIYIVDSFCLVFDTPFTEKTTLRLMDYLTEDLQLKIEGVVVNHFHEDCMTALDSLHARGITTYGNRRTIALAEQEGLTPPQRKFGRRKRLKLGDQEVVNYYPGPAHSSDNIVSYLPSERVLFGGCMLKTMNASRGNVADASLEKWSRTIGKVKKTFPEAELLVPGHGRKGGPELLDYTIELFAEDANK